MNKGQQIVEQNDEGVFFKKYNNHVMQNILQILNLQGGRRLSKFVKCSPLMFSPQTERSEDGVLTSAVIESALNLNVFKRIVWSAKAAPRRPSSPRAMHSNDLLVGKGSPKVAPVAPEP